MSHKHRDTNSSTNSHCSGMSWWETRWENVLLCRFYREPCDTTWWWWDFPRALWLVKGAPGAFGIRVRVRVVASSTNWSRWPWRRANRAREKKVARQKNITVKLVPPTVPHMCNPNRTWPWIHTCGGRQWSRPPGYVWITEDKAYRWN